MVEQIGVESLPALLDGPLAMTKLQKLPGIGPAKAEKIKRAWDRSRDMLPAAALAPPLTQSVVTSPTSAAPELSWDAATRCFAPDIFRAEATVASVLTRLAAQTVLEPTRLASLSGAQRVERWMNTNEEQTSERSAPIAHTNAICLLGL